MKPVDKKEPSEYIKNDLIYIAPQLNDHLARELSIQNNQKNSNISDRVLRLAEVTVKINELAFIKITDIETIIENSVR